MAKRDIIETPTNEIYFDSSTAISSSICFSYIMQDKVVKKMNIANKYGHRFFC